MNILLVQSNSEVREKLAFALGGLSDAEITDVNNPEEALMILQARQELEATEGREKANEASIDLIVYEPPTKETENSKKFEVAAKTVPMIICSDKKLEQHNLRENVVGVADKWNLLNDLAEMIRGLVRNGTLDASDPADFCKIRTRLLLDVIPLKGDVYIRLSKHKLVKLFHAGDQFEQSDMEKYTIKKGVEYLYLKKDTIPEFVEKYKADLEKMLRPSHILTAKELTKSSEPIFETVHELGKSFGFNKDVQSLARTQVRMTMKAMGRNPGLKDILKRLEDFKGNYIASHSILTGFLSCAIASQLDWGSEATFHKLTLAAFLHDITLEDHALAACDNMQEALEKGLDQNIDEFKDHPMKAAEAARQFSEVPPDVDVIIVQHHEKPDATGFPRGIGHAYISPLSAIFIVAHDLSKIALEDGDRLNIEAFAEAANQRYTSSHFRKVIKVLTQLEMDPKLIKQARG